MYSTAPRRSEPSSSSNPSTAVVSPPVARPKTRTCWFCRSADAVYSPALAVDSPTGMAIGAEGLRRTQRFEPRSVAIDSDGDPSAPAATSANRPSWNEVQLVRCGELSGSGAAFPKRHPSAKNG